MKNFVAAVRDGQPTAIFEDPFPLLLPAPGTSQPKRPMGQMVMFQRPEQKGDISQLWDLLRVKLDAQPSTARIALPGSDDVLVVWQDYNPHPDDAEVQNQWVWISTTCGAAMPFNEDEPSTSGLQKLLLLYPGGILDEGSDVDREFTPLVMTGVTNSGTVPYEKCLDFNPIGQPYLRSRAEMLNDERLTANDYVLAARIHIKGAHARPDADAAAKHAADATAKPADINVIFVADIDIVSGFFFELRERSEIFGERFARWQVDNVPFVLNVLDQLAGDSRFIEIRKRRRVHRELTAVQQLSEDAKKERNKARKDANTKFKKALDEEEAKFEEIYKKLENRKGVPPQQRQEELAIAQRNGRDRIEARKAQVDRQRDDEYRRIENQAAARIDRVQDIYKLLAVLLPPIPPLIIAICVFFVRRTNERESVSAGRRV
jgi:ABC-2 type transport system permease protein